MASRLSIYKAGQGGGNRGFGIRQWCIDNTRRRASINPQTQKRAREQATQESTSEVLSCLALLRLAVVVAGRLRSAEQCTQTSHSGCRDQSVGSQQDVHGLFSSPSLLPT